MMRKPGEKPARRTASEIWNSMTSRTGAKTK